jgi:molecular chaperone DnaK
MREDIFVPLILRGTALPVKKGDAFVTMYDGQKAVDVRMFQGEAPLDLNTARENLSAALGYAPATAGNASQATDAKLTLINTAKDLRKRAGVLLDRIDPTDALELRTLPADSQKAVSDGDTDKLAQLNESLSDMLFDLED